MEYKLQDLIDLEQLRKMLFDFYKITGCPLTIMDNDGAPIIMTIQEDICTYFHKANPVTCAHCKESDVYLSNNSGQGNEAVMYRCPRGLIDAAAPIIVDGHHLGNLFVGQFLTEEPDIEFYKGQAKEYGYDEKKYLEALSKVSIISKEQANKNLEFLKFIVEFIADLGLAKLREIKALQQIERAEEEISKREQYRIITENSSDMISLINPEGIFIYVSPACKKIGGYQPLDIIGHPVSEFCHPDDMRLFENINKNLKNHKSETYSMTFRFKKKDGEYIWAESNGWAIIDDRTGELREIQSSTRDITERKKAEEAIRLSEERFRTMFEQAPLGIALIDTINGKIKEINKEFSEIISRKENDIPKIDLESITHPDDIEEELSNMEQLKAGKIKGFNMDKRFINADGSNTWVNMTIAPIMDEDFENKRHLCMIKDITELKKVQEKILYDNFHDSLTGIGNRRMLEEYYDKVDGKDNITVSIMLGDINGLKLINDAYGHEYGDIIIRKIAKIIEEECGDKGIVARTGGDEFAALLPGVSYFESYSIVSKIQKRCDEESSGGMLLSISLGVATNIDEKQPLSRCFIIAEDRMYTSKLLEGKSLRTKVLSNLRTIMEEKTGETAKHCERMADMSQEFGTKLGLLSFQIEHLKLLSLMHDIGKSAVPDSVLLKQDKFDSIDMQTMKKHCEIGYRIANSMTELTPIAESILHHHERWDGTGYPYGLKGEEIPRLARIVSVLDAYDAMTHSRSYKKPLGPKEALEELKKQSGKQFDPEIVKVFIEKVLVKNK